MGDAGVEDELRSFVTSVRGAPVERVERIAGGGVGHRGFYRVTLRAGEPRTLVARVDRGEPGPGVLPEPPLEPLRSFLEAHGVPVPARIGGDRARRIDLLEDCGSYTLEDAVRSQVGLRRELYEEACDLVPTLQRLRDPSGRVEAFARALDAALMSVKAMRFGRSGLPAVLGRAPRDTELAVVRGAFEVVVDALRNAPRRLAHRDYQSRNLLVRTGAARGSRLVLIDLQGALLAPPEYDLVCLLRDSYVVWDDRDCEALAERVRPRLPDAPDAETFRTRFDLLTVARKAKDFALCHELAARGDDSWLQFAPPTLGYVRRALARVAGLDPRLAAFAGLLGDDACAR